MKKRMLSLALCLVLVVGLFSGLTVNASAGITDIIDKIKSKKNEIIQQVIRDQIDKIKEEFEIPDLDTDAIFESFTAAATEGDFGENNCLHWEVKGSLLGEQTLTISGTGVMPDFNFPKGKLAPWWNYKALGMIKAGIGGLNLNGIKIDPIGNLKRVIIGDGVTNVGDYALFCLPAATTPGVRTYTCTVCGQTKNEIIPATGGSGVCPGGPSCPSYGFSDVAGPSDWSHEGIDYCVRRSLMVGTGAGTFSPGMNCSRAQIVQILYNLSGDKTDYGNYYLPFTDVAPGAWYYDAVAWAYDNDVVSGTSATTFAPNDVITREQMAVILYGYTAEFAPEFTGNAASLNTFPDAGSVANWAHTAMSWAVGNGLISGMGSGGVSYLAPQGSATRAQASAIIMRYCQLIGQ